MNDIENPPAFPTRDFDEGMSLRDWFAGQLLGAMPDFNVAATSDADLEAVAAQFYRIADAMLRARIPNIDQHAPAAGEGEK